MSKKANPKAIGSFVLVALSLAILAVAMFGSASSFSKREPFILYFNDSLNGLETGAPVKFKGVTIGKVKKIMISISEDGMETRMPVVIEIDHELVKNNLGKELRWSESGILRRQIENGLRAKLELDNLLTGRLYVGLNFHPGAPSPSTLQSSQAYQEIPTLPGTFAALLDELGSLDLATISLRINSVLTRVDEVLREWDFQKTGQNLNQTLENLQNGIASVDFQQINAEAVASLKAARAILEDPEWKAALASFSETSSAVRDLVKRVDGKVDPVLEDLASVSQELEATLESARLALDRAGQVLADGSPLRQEIQTALGEIGSTARSMRLLLEFLNRNPNALIMGRSNQP